MSHLDKYTSCLRCKSKVLQDAEDLDLGTCGKCHTMQSMEGDEGLVAELIVRFPDGNLTLRAFGDVVAAIAKRPVADITMSALLKSSPFDISHKDGIIQSITRAREVTDS